MNPRPVICNTTLLSNFAAIDRVELLLRALSCPTLTTAQVIDEISAGVQAGYAYLETLESLLLSNSSPVEITSLDSNELATFRDLRLRLHAGEASCLAIAFHRRRVLGTDDLAARKIAQAKSVPVIGTLGALVLCRRGLLSLEEANRILQQIINSGYHSPVLRLNEFWK